MNTVQKIGVIILLLLSLLAAGCAESTDYTVETTPTPIPQQNAYQETKHSLNYYADTSAIVAELSAQEYTVHTVDFAKNKNNFYVLVVMIDTKGNYDKEVLDSYKIMHKNGVADYYVVGIADYEIQSSWSFTTTKKTLDDFFSGRITEDEYIKEVKPEKIL